METSVDEVTLKRATMRFSARRANGTAAASMTASTKRCEVSLEIAMFEVLQDPSQWRAAWGLITT